MRTKLLIICTFLNLSFVFAEAESFESYMQVGMCGDINVEFQCNEYSDFAGFSNLCISSVLLLKDKDKVVEISLPKEMQRSEGFAAQSWKCMGDSEKKKYIEVFYWNGGNINEFHYLYSLDGK